MNNQDKLAKDNQERWNAIVAAGSEFTRPFFDMTPSTAQGWIDNQPTLVKGKLTDVRGKDVLCLAGSGGQQTAVFALAGANVTVLDLSDAQLARDEEVAAHHNITIQIEHGDMRDLSRFANDSFDIVWQPYSINFVPDATIVIEQVSRILRPNGLYNLEFGNPFWTMEESDWVEGKGYPVRQPYVNGQPHQYVEPEWDVQDANGNWSKVEGPHEFMHTLSAIINALIANGFNLYHFAEYPTGDNGAKPGSWDHLCSIIPPFITIGSRAL